MTFDAPRYKNRKLVWVTTLLLFNRLLRWTSSSRSSRLQSSFDIPTRKSSSSTSILRFWPWSMKRNIWVDSAWRYQLLPRLCGFSRKCTRSSTTPWSYVCRNPFLVSSLCLIYYCWYEFLMIEVKFLWNIVSLSFAVSLKHELTTAVVRQGSLTTKKLLLSLTAIMQNTTWLLVLLSKTFLKPSLAYLEITT